MSTQIPHVIDGAADLWIEHGISSQPSMVFVSADGSTDVRVGSLGPQGLQNRAQALLAES